MGVQITQIVNILKTYKMKDMWGDSYKWQKKEDSN